MNFGNLDLTVHADRGAVLQVRHPVFKNQILEGVTITLLGYDSSMRKRRYADFKKKAVQNSITGAATDCVNETDEIRALSVLSWTGIEYDGVTVEFNLANAKREFERHEWLAQQVDNFIADRKNFFLTEGNDLS